MLSKIYKIEKPSSLTSGLVQVTDFNVLPNVTPLRNALIFSSIRRKRTTGFSGRSFGDDDPDNPVQSILKLHYFNDVINISNVNISLETTRIKENRSILYLCVGQFHIWISCPRKGNFIISTATSGSGCS